MAFFTIPLKSLAAASSSSCLYSHILYSRELNSRKYKLRVSGSIRVGNRQSLPLRKKRKLRPSFYDQVREKWSRRIESERDIFPWEETEKHDGEEEVEDRQRLQFGYEDVVSESRFGANEPVIHPSADSDIPRPSISPPRTHGSQPRKTQFGSEVGVSERSGKRGEEAHGVGQIRGKDGNGLRTENKAVHVDAMPIALSRIGEKAMIGDVKTLSFSGKLKGSSDGNRSSVDLPWKREEVVGGGDRKWRRSDTEFAERILPEHELRRLRNVSLRMLERTKVGVAGITQALVASIHQKWRVDEVVKLKFEGALAINMRTHEILERKTGGLVIWRSGSSIVLYRGIAYKLPCVQLYAKQASPIISEQSTDAVHRATDDIRVNNSFGEKETYNALSGEFLKYLSKEELMDLTELNHLLDELGPRYHDWSGCDPIPVDADKLPSVVPGYRCPSRLVPHGMRHCLKDKGMTEFRWLARSVPPHFALGRNRDLQGLAKAMLKLRDKSFIAKIAIKCGVLNTRNEKMAEELKV